MSECSNTQSDSAVSKQRWETKDVRVQHLCDELVPSTLLPESAESVLHLAGPVFNRH